MQYTIFDTPVVRTIIKLISRITLGILRWRTVGIRDSPQRYVMIAAPHTSNWDFPLMMSMAFNLNIKAYWMGKHTLFRKPFGPVFRWLGGLPIDRRKSVNTVDQCVKFFNDNSRLVLVSAPEGTRSKVDRWKSGFYHIASGAKVPIAFGFLDYKRKVGGVGAMYNPTGNIEKDMLKIREFYSNITGKHPQNFSV